MPDLPDIPEKDRTPDNYPDPDYWSGLTHLQITLTRYQRHQVNRGFNERRKQQMDISNKSYTLSDYIRDLIALDISEFSIDLGDPPTRGGYR